MSPPQAELVNLDLARSSPFGPLSQISSRRTFAYLIATLNASHPDYDFSDTLKPGDFHRERSLRRVMNTIDDAIYNVRPRPAAALLAAPTPPKTGKNHPTSPPLGAGQSWGPKAWKAIDREMSLTECGESSLLARPCSICHKHRFECYIEYCLATVRANSDICCSRWTNRQLGLADGHKAIYHYLLERATAVLDITLERHIR